jgi:hypothetical protein
MEVPLDRQVGKQIGASTEAKKLKRRKLPRWKTVIGLEYTDSSKFQKVATTIARQKGVTRVDLDVYYWRNPAMPNHRIHSNARKSGARG